MINICNLHCGVGAMSLSLFPPNYLSSFGLTNVLESAATTYNLPICILVQIVLNLSVSEIARTIKSITARQLFQKYPDIQLKLWGGNFWTSGYYSNTVGQYANEEVIRKYVESQGQQKECKKVYQGQLTLF